MAISGKRIILQNNQALRAKDENGDVQELVKIDASGALAGKIKEYIDQQDALDQSAISAIEGDVSSLDGRLDTLEAGSSTAGSVDFKVAAEAALREAGDTATLASAEAYADSLLAAIEDDVSFHANLAAFPLSGEDGVIYAAKDSNKLYRYSEVIVPGSFDHTVGPTGDFATLQDALASASVEDGDSIEVQAGTYVLTSTLVINKRVKIFGVDKATVILESPATSSAPTTLISVTVDDVVLSKMTIKHKKTSNTSVETAISVSAGAWPTFTYVSGFVMDNCRVEYCEFGVVIRGNGFKIANSEIAYATGTVSNSNRAIGVYGSQGECFIKDNVIDNSLINGTACRAIYSTSTNASSNELCSGKLIVEGNSHLGALQQFYLQDNVRGTAGGYDLFFVDNVTNETSLFAGIFLATANQGDLFGQVVLEGNSISNNHDAATGFGKGLFAIDGASASLIDYRSANLPVHSSSNTLGQLSFRADYAEATNSSGSIVGYKPAVFNPVAVAFDAVIPSIPSAPATPSGGGSSVTQEYVELSAAGDLSAIEADILALEGRMDTAESDIGSLQSDMALKASQLDLDALELRVTDAEGDIDDLESDMALKASQADLDALELEVDDKLDSSLKGVANGLAELDSTGKVPTSQLPSLQSVEAVKMAAITLSASDITNGYVDLTHEAMSSSIHVVCERVMILEDFDYTVSTVGGVSRLTWIGPSVAGAEEEFAEGDVVYISYLRQL